MNPYEILDVPATASEQQIKSAYRKRAKATHPDAQGGDGDLFAQASRAYAILMDPEARKRFDETGSIEDVAPLTIRQRMIQILVGLFNAALQVEGQRRTSLKHFDLMEAMRQQMKANLAEGRNQLATYRKALADRQVLLKRITRHDDGENLFADIIRQQLPEFERVRNLADLDVRAMEMANDELLHYKSEVELIQAVQMMQFGGAFTGTTTRNWVFRT